MGDDGKLRWSWSVGLRDFERCGQATTVDPTNLLLRDLQHRVRFSGETGNMAQRVKPEWPTCVCGLRWLRKGVPLDAESNRYEVGVGAKKSLERGGDELNNHLLREPGDKRRGRRPLGGQVWPKQVQ